MADDASLSSLDAVLREMHRRFSFMDLDRVHVDSRSFLGDTPLHVTAREGDYSASSTLLDAGADPNAKGDLGFTPLHCAVLAGHAEIVSLLLEHGASCKETDMNGYTPLDIAATGGGTDEIRALLYARVS